MFHASLSSFLSAVMFSCEQRMGNSDLSGNELLFQLSYCYYSNDLFWYVLSQLLPLYEYCLIVIFSNTIYYYIDILLFLKTKV